MRAEFDRLYIEAMELVDEAVDLRFSSESSLVVVDDEPLPLLGESENVKQRRIAFTVSMCVGVELACKSFVWMHGVLSDDIFDVIDVMPQCGCCA